MSTAEYNKLYRKQNPERIRALKHSWNQQNRSRARASSKRGNAIVKATIRAFVIAAKTRPCMDCGGTFDPICMDFDHRLDEVKVKNVSQLRTLADIRVEIAKCDVVCSNCHRLRTQRQGQWGPKGKTAGATRPTESAAANQLELPTTKD